MSPSRTLPLFDPQSWPSSWNERMSPGEYAVHPSSFGDPGPFCIVFSSLAEAEQYASGEIGLHPELRYRIYDHQGLIGAPIREIKGSKYRGESDISPRFRRWVGSLLFFGGLGLTILDWSHDFRLSWPAMIGTRMLIPGALLLVIEAVIILHARRARTHTPTPAGRPS